jgi:DNA-directed RNA polymerase specialized sigma24 family protein
VEFTCSGGYTALIAERPFDKVLQMNEVTRILSALERGDPHAAEQLLPLVYDELRKLAAQKMAQEKPGQTLQATALVHEAYLRLVAPSQSPPSEGGTPPQSPPSQGGGKGGVRWDHRGHFFAAAAEAMRRILVENARRKGRIRHGGGRRREHADLEAVYASGTSQDLLALHEALEQFATHDPLKAKLVELRFFGGLTLEQAAECLGISLSTADRAWRYARAWLYHAMAGDDSEKK